MLTLFSCFLSGHIKSIGADLVGLQECQDSGGIAAAAGYSLLGASAPSRGNTILYKGGRLQALNGGFFDIPSDVSTYEMTHSVQL